MKNKMEALLITAVLLFSVPSYATILTFDDSGKYLATSHYKQDGYTLNVSSGGSFDAMTPSGIHFSKGANWVTLTNDVGDDFFLTSFDLVAGWLNVSWTLTSGIMVADIITQNGTYNVPNWGLKMTSFSFLYMDAQSSFDSSTGKIIPSSDQVIIDNIAVNSSLMSVPEPSLLALMGLGFLGLSSFRKKNLQSQWLKKQQISHL